MRSIYMTSVFLCLPLLFAACSSGSSNNQNNTSDISVSLSEVQQEHVLNDEMSLLGSLGNVKMLDETTWIAMDNAPGVYLFEDHVMTASFGQTGKGPCEFEEVSAIDSDGKNVYVLDASQSKIITYNMESQECVGEFDQEHLQGSYYLHKEENKPSFIVANTSYTSLRPDSTRLVYRIFDNETSEPLSLQLGQVNAVKTILSMRSNTLGMEEHAGKLYSYFPLTDSLYTINLQDYSFDAFPLQVDVKKEELESAGQNVDKLLEIIRGDFDFVSDLLVSKDWIAVMNNLRAAREDEEPTRSLQFYAHDGAFLDAVPIENKVMGVIGNTIIFAKENTDPNAEFTYSATYRTVTLN